MNRWGLILVAAAIALGGLFELLKRSSWPTISAPQESGETHFNANPYSRPPVASRTNPLRRGGILAHTGSVRRLGKPVVQAVPQTGQFDTHIAPPVAATDQKPQTQGKQAKADSEHEKKEKKCRPKEKVVFKTAAELRTKRERRFARGANDPLDRVNDKNYERLHAGKKGEPRPEDELEEECKENDEVAKQEQKADEPKPEDKSNDKHDEVGALGGPATISGGLLTNNPAPQLTGLEEWKKRLLDQPNFKETVRLIEMVQTGQISTELFYTLVHLMLKDPRREIQELGVLAAGRTPSLESFHILIDVVKRENFGSALRARAESELNIYEQSAFLPILSQVMRASDDSYAVVWATKQVEDSARRYLSAKYNHNRPPSGGTGGTSAQNPYVNVFRPFIALLQQMTSSKDSQQSAQARETLQSLQTLLGAVS